MTHSENRKSGLSSYANLFWLLSMLFSLRVLGQAIQRWMPQPFLPPFADFQGSSIAYPLLLSTQLLILGLMLRTAWRAQRGMLLPNRRIGAALACFGALYMAGSLLRIGIGLAVPDAAAWFSAWISAVFHIVLAAFALALAAFHLRAGGQVQAIAGSVE